MENICKKCAIDPTSHSFRKLSEKNGISTYYTNPAKAKLYKDTEGILEHYNNALELIGNNKWSWIFDSDGFDLHHAMEIQTGIGIAKITVKYGNNLEEIKIINPTWYIKVMLTVVMPFLSDKIRQKINIMDDRFYSILEFV
jgi:hypothetical protein